MNSALISAAVAIDRVALPLTPAIVRATIPPTVAGAYCVYRRSVPVYVGRSDCCVRTRLLTHAASCRGTHFVWQMAGSDAGAYLLECIWYHELVLVASAENLIHPAKPLAPSIVSCPICDEQDRRAVQEVLRRLMFE